MNVYTSADTKVLLRERDGPIAILTLNRPQARNSLSEALLIALSEAWSDIAADKTVRAVIEVVAVEFVDAHPDRAGCDERIEVELLVVEITVHARHALVREVAADHSFVGDGIIRLSDFRQQQKLHVEDRESR